VARLDDLGPCPCGNEAGLTLAAIEGRLADVTFTPAGHVVTVDDLDGVLADIPGLNGWQLDLPQPGVLRLRILASSGGDAMVRRHCLERLRALYGSRAEVEITVAKALRHERSGKFRFTRPAFSIDHTVLWRRQG
jgi:hypothetical protein